MTVPRRDFGAVTAGLPFVYEKFSTYGAFAEANVAAILGDKLKQAHELRANTLASMVFLNRGSHF